MLLDSYSEVVGIVSSALAKVNGEALTAYGRHVYVAREAFVAIRSRTSSE